MRRAPATSCALVLLLALTARAQERSPEDALRAMTARDTEWTERRLAAHEVAGRGDVRPLLEALASPDQAVQAAARVGLLAMGPPVVETLRARLAEAPNAERALLAQAIGDFGPAALPAAADLGGLLEKGPDGVARAARRALLAIGRGVDAPFDRVTREDGGVLEGVVRERTADWVAIDVVQHGEDGDRVLATKLPAKKAASVAMAPAEVRPILLARLASIRDQEGGRTPVSERPAEGGGSVRVAETEHFRIESSAPADFVGEAAWRIEAMAQAYEDEFRTPVQPGARVRVILAGSRKEYDAIQTEILGRVVENPAFYVPSADLILGFTEIERWREEVSKVSAAHDTLQTEIAAAETALRGARVRLARDVNDVVDALREEARQAKKSEGLSQAEQRALIKRVDAALTAELEKLDAVEEAIQKDIRRYEQILAAKKKEIRAIEAHNHRLLDEVGRSMFRTLAHEAFHAFFRQRVVRPEHTEVDVRWLDEGLAMYFESSVFDGGRLVAGEPDADWIRFLQGKKGALVGHDELFAGKQEDFVVHTEAQSDRSNTFYLQSWYLVRLLKEHGHLVDPGTIAAYVADIADGKDPAEAFQRLIGDRPQALWNVYLSHLATDDAERYGWLEFAPGAGPEVDGPVLGRITMRVNKKVHVRLRTGETCVVEEGQVGQVARR